MDARVEPVTLRIGPFVFDRAGDYVTISGQKSKIRSRSKEAHILWLLAEHADYGVSLYTIRNTVWGKPTILPNTVRVNVSCARDILTNVEEGGREYLVTVQGGWMLRTSLERSEDQPSVQDEPPLKNIDTDSRSSSLPIIPRWRDRWTDPELPEVPEAPPPKRTPLSRLKEEKAEVRPMGDRIFSTIPTKYWPSSNKAQKKFRRTAATTADVPPWMFTKRRLP